MLLPVFITCRLCSLSQISNRHEPISCEQSDEFLMHWSYLPWISPSNPKCTSQGKTFVNPHNQLSIIIIWEIDRFSGERVSYHCQHFELHIKNVLLVCISLQVVYIRWCWEPQKNTFLQLLIVKCRTLVVVFFFPSDSWLHGYAESLSDSFNQFINQCFELIGSINDS